MKIQKEPSDITITLNPKEYWLRKRSNTATEFYDSDYVLTQRIDMSYKGKEDQEGGIFMYLSTEEAEKFKEAGFDEIEG